MGQTQFLSRWLWTIVNKVKLITDGRQLWFHILPGAGGSHVGSSLKLWRRRLLHMWISHRSAQVIVITRRVGSFVSNVSINRQSPAILFLYPRDTYLWSLVLLCEHLQLIMCALLTQTWNPDVQLYKQKVSHHLTPKILVPWGTGCLFALKQWSVSVTGFILITERFFFNEPINSTPIHVQSPSRQNDSNCQTQSLPPLTVGPIKGWMFWSDSLKQSFTWRKKKKGVTIMLLIMWGRQGSAGVTVSFKKPYLLSSTHSVRTCV